MKIFLLLACAVLLSISASAADGAPRKKKTAQAKPAKVAWEKDCAEDKKALCKDVPSKDEPQVLQCFREHVAELSASCDAFFVKNKKSVLEKNKGLKACEPDMAKFCSDVEPGGGRVVECMKSHASELSAECREFVATKGAPK
jgi:hypothetical protein